MTAISGRRLQTDIQNRDINRWITSRKKFSGICFFCTCVDNSCSNDMKRIAVISVLERYRKVNILTNITVNSHHSSTHTSIPVRSNHYLRECKVILTHSTAADSTVKVPLMSTVDELSYSTNRLAYATLPCSPAWSWTSSSTAYSRGSSAGSGTVTSYLPLGDLLASHSCMKFFLAANWMQSDMSGVMALSHWSVWQYTRTLLFPHSLHGFDIHIIKTLTLSVHAGLFSYFHKAPKSDMDYRIFNVHVIIWHAYKTRATRFIASP